MLPKGEIEEAIPQKLTNSTAHSSQFEFSNYEEAQDDQDSTNAITFTGDENIKAAALHNNEQNKCEN